MIQTTDSSRDRKAYDLAKEFLVGLDVEGVTPDLIEKYLSFSTTNPRPNSLPEIYSRILESAQNANMKARIVGGAIDGINNLKPALCGFEPRSIISTYSNDWSEVLDTIVQVVKPKGKIRRTPKSIWPRYCQTILSAASFLAKFESADDFYNWADFFDKDDRARAALPMLLSEEIKGIGFALACDFLKELGYVRFGKPDVQIKGIFKELNLCSSNASDYEVFNAIVRVAKNVGVTPYNVDKLFWLIGSGTFYDDRHLGKQGRIGGRKKQFIAYATQRGMN